MAIRKFKTLDNFKPHNKNKKSSTRKNNSGFSLVHFSTLLPVVLSFIVGTSYFILRAHAFTRHQSVCQSELYRAYDEISIHLNELLKLNPSVTRLRIQIKFAEMKQRLAIAAGNEILAAKYELQIIKLKNEQISIDTKQKQLLFIAENLRQKLVPSAHRAFKDKYVSIVSSQLKVAPDEPNTIAPFYEVFSNIELLQKAQLTYVEDKVTRSCTVTLVKRNLLYRATLSSL